MQWTFLEEGTSDWRKAGENNNLPAFYESKLRQWEEKELGPLEKIGFTKLPDASKLCAKVNHR